MLFSAIFSKHIKTSYRLYSSSVNKFTNRTHTCGELTIQDVGKRVKLLGWVQATRFNNKILIIRDSYGSTQCIMNKSLPNIKNLRQQSIQLESIVQVSGLVQARPDYQIKSDKPTGSVEIVFDDLQIINPALSSLPILPKDDNVTHANRLKYRYIDLRRSEMQQSLRFRSRLCEIIRDRLLKLEFVECETPTLFNRTPGGANEFIVPSQEKGKYYNLVQSPQQLKQLLMIGGLDRYFQFSRCYRDEATRPDRQPEFTQVDIELSFTNVDHVISLIDEILLDIFTEFSIHNIKLTNEYRRLPRISFHDAFKLYGTDKPDLRFDWKIKDVEDFLELRIPTNFNSECITKWLEKATEKLKIEQSFTYYSCSGDTIIRTKNSSDDARISLGEARNIIASELSNIGQDVYSRKYAFVWVTDFPLFTKNPDDTWSTCHHPFTAPTDDTAYLIDTEPASVKGQHYDLVLNGNEIGGGSIRIHDACLQNRIFEVLNVDGKKFDYFIEALKSGCPPHGGIAIGLDRFVSLLLNKDSIRETIAFPKSSSGRDLMTNTPHELDENVLSLYHQTISNK